MPQFAPSVQKTAVAPITVAPAGLNCEAELFLGPNDATPVVSSGLKSFSSTGSQQNVTAPIVMPSAAGTYHVYIDLYVAGMYLAGYQATEDVIIAAPALPFTYAFACSLGTCPSATAYGIAQMSGTIRNNNSVSVSQNVKVMWSKWSKTYGKWVSCAGQFVSSREYCVCSLSPCLVNPFPVSLSPGAQQSFSYQGYCSGVDPSDPGWTPCSPLLMKNYNYYFWLEDDAGGKSNEVILST